MELHLWVFQSFIFDRDAVQSHAEMVSKNG